MKLMMMMTERKKKKWLVVSRRIRKSCHNGIVYKLKMYTVKDPLSLVLETKRNQEQ